MKHLKHLLAALVFVSLIVFTNCGGGGGSNDPDPFQQQADKLVGSWTLSPNSAKLESAIQADWNGFSLTVTGDADGGTYSTSGVPSGAEAVWPSSGNWVFDENSSGIVVRDGNLDINVTVTTSTLTLGFTFNSGARTNSVNGNWTFSFNAD